MSRILDKTFKYVPAVETDISKTFERVRKRQKAEAERDAANQREAAQKVEQLSKRSRNGTT